MIQCRALEKGGLWESERSLRLSSYPRLFIRTALMSKTEITTETDEQFLARFYRLHEAAVRTMLRKSFCRQIVEDELYEAQIKVLRNRAMLESKNPYEARAWLKKVVLNASIDSNRKTRRETAIPEDFQIAEHDESENTVFIEILEDLRDCQNKLNAKDQALIHGRYFLGTSCAELASELSMTSDTAVSRRLMIIRKLLELCLTQSGSES